MAFLIDQLNNSGLFAQSAYSAGITTCDSDGNVITATYLSSVDLTPYQTTADMINYQTVSGMSAYATTGELANKLDTTAFNIPDSANWNSNYETVQNNSATWNTVTDKLDSTAYTPFDPTYISGTVDNKLDTTAFSDVSGTFLTAHQSLADYATTAWVDSQGYLTAHQPISADEWNNVYDTVNVYSGSWTGSETSPTASVDSHGSIDIVSSNNTVYFDVNGTWFNDAVNSAVDVPTGVMVESACQYNAVNEISGYNGSAIAQYGAEKQWLQHDDTIVHVANSAQYAFGVNVSALQRLMGIDETVLWSGTSDFKILETSAILSDNLLNFKYVDLYVRAWERIQVIRKELYTPSLVPTLQCMIGWNETAGNRIVGINYVYNSADNSVTRSACAFNTINGTTITSSTIPSNAGGIYKIVGIGRKS